jgi:hypothetical protein
MVLAWHPGSVTKKRFVTHKRLFMQESIIRKGRADEQDDRASRHARRRREGASVGRIHVQPHANYAWRGELETGVIMESVSHRESRK